MSKKEFTGWKRDIMDVEVEYDDVDKVVLYFYGNIYPKKNSKRAFRWIVLPSENFVHWHKLMSDKLKWHIWIYNTFPCRMSISTIAWNKVKWDVDNAATSLLDLLVDVWLLPDDNKFVVQELEVRNVGYIKNAPICRVELTPITHPVWDTEEDHKDKNLKLYKNYLLNN